VLRCETEYGLQMFGHDPGARQSIDALTAFEQQHALPRGGEQFGRAQTCTGSADYDGIKSFGHASPICLAH
jgi:hypothetical protein